MGGDRHTNATHKLYQKGNEKCCLWNTVSLCDTQISKIENYKERTAKIHNIITFVRGRAHF